MPQTSTENENKKSLAFRAFQLTCALAIAFLLVSPSEVTAHSAPYSAADQRPFYKRLLPLLFKDDTSADDIRFVPKTVWGSAASGGPQMKQRAWEAGQHASEKAGSWAGQAKDKAAEWTGEWTDQAKEMAGEWSEQAKENAGEWAGQAKGKAGEWTGQAKDKAGEWTGQAKDKAREWTGQAKEKTGEMTGEAKETAGGWIGKIKEKAGEWTGQAKEKTEEVSDEAEETAGSWMGKIKEKAGEWTGQAKEKTEEVSDEAEETAGSWMGKIKEKAGEWTGQAKDTAGQAKDAAGDAKDAAKDAAGSWTGRAKKMAGGWTGSAKDKVGQAQDDTEEWVDEARQSAGSWASRMGNMATHPFDLFERLERALIERGYMKHSWGDDGTESPAPGAILYESESSYTHVSARNTNTSFLVKIDAPGVLASELSAHFIAPYTVVIEGQHECSAPYAPSEPAEPHSDHHITTPEGESIIGKRKHYVPVVEDYCIPRKVKETFSLRQPNLDFSRATVRHDHSGVVTITVPKYHSDVEEKVKNHPKVALTIQQ